VVQVEGWGPELECWIVDRFDISASARKESETRFAAINPAAYVEDWDILLEEVIRKTYPIETAPEKRMQIRLVLNDWGGSDGVTANALAFWRKVRRLGAGHRYQLLRGEGKQLNAPPVKQTYPVSRESNVKRAVSTGDVPVWVLNVNLLKDAVAGELARTAPGPGYVHLPAWLDASFFRELTAETRGAKGWERPTHARNESLDLHVYNRAANLILRGDQINWSTPPEWVAQQIVDLNATAAPVKSLSDLGRMLNG
jgi:phage terminase large subunit GpA-like protein